MTDADRLRAAGLRSTAARHGSRAGDHRHHIVCRRCGTVTEVDCVARHGPCPEPAASAWFRVDEVEVTFWGLCAACQAPGGAAARPHPEPAAPQQLTRPGLGVAHSSD